MLIEFLPLWPTVKFIEQKTGIKVFSHAPFKKIFAIGINAFQTID